MPRRWTDAEISEALEFGLDLLDQGYRLEVATRHVGLPAGALAWALRERAQRSGARRGNPFTYREVDAKRSLAATDPGRAALLVPELNPPGLEWRIARTSGRHLWWRCAAGSDHVWRAPVNNVVAQGSGCPCCHGLQVCAANNLEAVFPHLVAEMHPTRNGNVRADHIVARGHTDLWWACPKGPDHEWRTSVKLRGIAGTGCPSCGGLQLSVTNSMLTVHPHLAKQVDVAANGGVGPDQIIAYTNKPVAWFCPQGHDHRWKASGSSRASGNGCPFCANFALADSNRLSLVDPEVAAQLDPSLNAGVTAHQVIAGGTASYTWRCRVNPAHTWPARIASRIRLRSGCPQCCVAPRSSIEVHLAHHLATVLPVKMDEHKVRVGRRLFDVDILIPELRVAVEYDGSYWHRDKEEKDRSKTAALTAAGWHVVRVREEPLRLLGVHDVPARAGTSPLVMAQEVIYRLRAMLPAGLAIPDVPLEGAPEREAEAEVYLDGLRAAHAAKKARRAS